MATTWAPGALVHLPPRPAHAPSAFQPAVHLAANVHRKAPELGFPPRRRPLARAAQQGARRRSPALGGLVLLRGLSWLHAPPPCFRPHRGSPLQPLGNVLLGHDRDLKTRRRSKRKRVQSLLVHRRVDHDPVQAICSCALGVVQLERELDPCGVANGWNVSRRIRRGRGGGLGGLGGPACRRPAPQQGSVPSLGLGSGPSMPTRRTDVARPRSLRPVLPRGCTARPSAHGPCSPFSAGA